MHPVKFTSKMDRSFKIMLSVMMIFLFCIFGSIFIVEDTLTLVEIMMIIGSGVFTIGLILWLSLDITYEFREEHLFVRAGFIFSRIPYKEIESYKRIHHFIDIMSGFNLLSSTKALEILAPNIPLGVIKISPSNMEQFIEELDRRMTVAKKES